MFSIRKKIQVSKSKKLSKQLTDIQLDKKVLIQGTNFDRKRKLKYEDIAEAIDMYNAGVCVAEIARHFGVHPGTIRYNIIPGYREYLYSYMKSKTHDQNMKMEDRVAYKRELIKKGQVILTK